MTVRRLLKSWARRPARHRRGPGGGPFPRRVEMRILEIDDEVAQVHGTHRLRRMTEARAGPRVRVQDPAVPGHEEDRVARLLHEGVETRLAPVQALVVEARLEEVAGDARQTLHQAEALQVLLRRRHSVQRRIQGQHAHVLAAATAHENVERVARVPRAFPASARRGGQGVPVALRGVAHVGDARAGDGLLTQAPPPRAPLLDGRPPRLRAEVIHLGLGQVVVAEHRALGQREREQGRAVAAEHGSRFGDLVRQGLRVLERGEPLEEVEDQLGLLVGGRHARLEVQVRSVGGSGLGPRCVRVGRPLRWVV